MPLRSLQRALDLAEPGTIIALAEGVYDPAETRRLGWSDAPIVVRGVETGRIASAGAAFARASDPCR